MTRWMALGVLMLWAMAGPVAPALAAMAAITTVAPVEDEATEDGVKAAAVSALGRAVRGARAMGLADVTLKSIRMVPGTGVVVEMDGGFAEWKKKGYPIAEKPAKKG